MSETDKPEEALTIVTVKGVEVEAWKRAKDCAKARDEMMGSWLSRALNLLADRQKQDGLFPPDKLEDQAEPLPAPPVFSMSDLQATLLAAQVAVDRRVPPELMAEALLVLENTLRAANGRPPRRRPLPLHRLVSGLRLDPDGTNRVPPPGKPD